MRRLPQEPWQFRFGAREVGSGASLFSASFSFQLIREALHVSLNLDLGDELSARLEDAARRLNVSTQDLARAAIRDLLARQGEEFERAAERVLEKNAELYKRLA